MLLCGFRLTLAVFTDAFGKDLLEFWIERNIRFEKISVYEIFSIPIRRDASKPRLTH